MSELLRPVPTPSWRDRIAALVAQPLRPWRVAAGVLAVVVGSALLISAALWLVRTPPPPPEVALPMAESSRSTGSTGEAGPAGPAGPAGVPVGTPSTTAEGLAVVVQAAGAVKVPGVYRIGPEARVVDLIDAAGGLAADADADQLSLAAHLSDGQRVYVPRLGETVTVPLEAALPQGPIADAANLIDLNVATASELENLPGVGPAIAAAIVEHRQRNGPFTSVEGLLDVAGIGEAKLAAVRELATV